MVFSMARTLLWLIYMFLVAHPILSQTCNGGLSFKFGGSKPPSFSLELQRDCESLQSGRAAIAVSHYDL